MSTSRPSPEPLLVRPVDAARMLGVSRPYVYRMMDRGDLGRVQLPGSRAVRIPLADVYAAAGQPVPEAS